MITPYWNYVGSADGSYLENLADLIGLLDVEPWEDIDPDAEVLVPIRPTRRCCERSSDIPDLYGIVDYYFSPGAAQARADKAKAEDAALDLEYKANTAEYLQWRRYYRYDRISK